MLWAGGRTIHMQDKEYIVAQPSSLEEYQAALDVAQQQAAEFEDKYLRAAALAENARKQAQRNAEARINQRMRDFCLALLEVADNLERALAYATEDNPLYVGVHATLRQFYETLEREGVAPLTVSLGMPFNPHQHEAVETVVSTDMPDMSVAAVRQTGYAWAGQILRPARVVVARSPQASA